MPEELKIEISAEVDKAIANFKKFENSLKSFATGSVKQLEAAAAGLRNQLESLSATALKSDFGKQLSQTLQTVEARLKTVRQEAGLMGEKSVDVFKKLGHEVKNFATFIPGLAIGAVLGVASTFVEELVSEFIKGSDAAGKLKEAIDRAAGSMDKNAASVFVMVRALQSGTLSSTEFKKVKAELIAQAPEFQKSFDGDKISIDASDTALTKYITKLSNTVRVTAALAIVNDTLSKSIATIAKGGEITKIESITNLFSKLNPTTPKEIKISNPLVESVKKAEEALKAENISKLIDDTFKKLGISFNDLADTVDGNALKKQLEKIKADFEKFQTETIAKAKQFNKEFGSAFVLPDLEETFFHGKQAVFKDALKELTDIKSGNLKIKLPKVEFELLPDAVTPLTKDQLDDLTKRFFSELKGVPVDIVLDTTISLDNKKLIDDKLKLRKKFEDTFGDLGLKAFGKINFDNLTNGLDAANKKFDEIKLTIDTLTTSISDGLGNAFSNVFDAILEGKSVFKALGESIKALVVDTIKAIAKMFILKAVTKALGVGLPIPIPGVSGGTANFGLGGAVGNRSFNNILQVVVTGQISGSTINLAGQRAANSAGRFG